MYRMLVKVFNVDTSHFVLKAALVAWGMLKAKIRDTFFKYKQVKLHQS